MSATSQDIERWLEEAKTKGATHLIVACDQFDYTNYPVYVMPADNIRTVMQHYLGKNMQTIDEIYNMKLDIQEQLNEFRAWHPELAKQPA